MNTRPKSLFPVPGRLLLRTIVVSMLQGDRGNSRNRQATSSPSRNLTSEQSKAALDRYQSELNAIGAADLISYVLAVMHLKTRRVHIAGITPSPNARWMKQVCRNLTDCEDGILKYVSHLIVDRDTSFIAMRRLLEQTQKSSCCHRRART